MENELLLFNKSALQGVLTDPLCADYKTRWRKCGTDKEKLVRMVMNQQALAFFHAHCFRGFGLSKEYILDSFADYINGKYTGTDVDGVEGGYKTQLYAGFGGDVSETLDVVSFQWCKITPFVVPQCKAIKMYVGCSSEVHLECEGYNSIVVMLFDNSTVHLDDIDEDSTVVIYRYSQDANVEVGRFCLSDKVRIFDKTLRL